MTTTLPRIATPCPPWCDHHIEHTTGESDHFSAPVQTPLASFGVQMSYSEPTDAPYTIVVGGVDDMTASEARQLAAVILELADVAEGKGVGRLIGA